MIHLILLGFAALALYVLVAAARPTRPCRRCKGKRVVPRPLSRKKFRACPRCRATGLQYRRGATAVHRFIQIIKAERAERGK